MSLCKDIARHASQLEAESHGVEQSTDRYLEFKNLLLSCYLQGEDNFEVILGEFRKTISSAYNLNPERDVAISARNHMLCMFEYFLVLANEANKD